MLMPRLMPLPFDDVFRAATMLPLFSLTQRCCRHASHTLSCRRDTLCHAPLYLLDDDDVAAMPDAIDPIRFIFDAFADAYAMMPRRHDKAYMIIADSLAMMMPMLLMR